MLPGFETIPVNRRHSPFVAHLLVDSSPAVLKRMDGHAGCNRLTQTVASHHWRYVMAGKELIVEELGTLLLSNLVNKALVAK